MAVKPLGGLCIERLKTICVVNEPLDHQSESPDNQKYQDRKDNEGHNDRDDKSQQLWNSVLERTLKWPRNGDCE